MKLKGNRIDKLIKIRYLKIDMSYKSLNFYHKEVYTLEELKI